jgi:LPS sulfotransferase NodH
MLWGGSDAPVAADYDGDLHLTCGLPAVERHLYPQFSDRLDLGMPGAALVTWWCRRLRRRCKSDLAVFGHRPYSADL